MAKTDISKSKEEPEVCPACGAKKQAASYTVETPYPYTLTYVNGYVSPPTTTGCADQGQNVVAYTITA